MHYLRDILLLIYDIVFEDEGRDWCVSDDDDKQLIDGGGRMTGGLRLGDCRYWRWRGFDEVNL